MQKKAPMLQCYWVHGISFKAFRLSSLPIILRLCANKLGCSRQPSHAVSAALFNLTYKALNTWKEAKDNLRFINTISKCCFYSLYITMTVGLVLIGSSNKWAEKDSLNHDVIPLSEYQQHPCWTVLRDPVGCSTCLGNLG